tara:strand:- start:6617 stop:7354 length:738 start_codon:yes stop_codon:yes gene_type:complete
MKKSMYILFKTMTSPGWCTQINTFLNYTLGYIPAEYNDLRVNLEPLHASQVSEEVAAGWMFVGYGNQIKIKKGSQLADRLWIQSSEPEELKQIYEFTAEDKAKGLVYMKAVMRKWIEDRFNQRFGELYMEASNVEKATWGLQKAEALAYVNDNDAVTPTLDILSAARGITKANLVTKVINSVNSYNDAAINLLKEQQTIEDKVKACSTRSEANVVMYTDFGRQISPLQERDLGNKVPTGGPTQSF